MSSEDNPIVALAKEVLDGKRSEKEAVQQASSPTFVREVSDSHLSEICALVGALYEIRLDRLLLPCRLAVNVAKSKGVEPELWALLNLFYGAILHLLLQPKRAIDHLQTARTAFEAVGSKVLVAFCTLQTIVPYLGLGLFRESIELARQAKREFLEQGMQSEAALCDLMESNAWAAWGNFNKAFDVLDSARIIFVERGEQTAILECDLLLAKFYRSQRQDEKALGICRGIIESAQSRPTKFSAANAHLLSGGIYSFIGSNHLAKEHFSLAKKICEELGLEYLKWEIEIKTAMVLLIEGSYESSLETLRSGREFFLSRGFETDVALVDLFIGTVLRSQGNHQGALSLLQASTAYFRKTGLTEFETISEVALASSYRELGQKAQAVELLEEIIRNDRVWWLTKGDASLELGRTLHEMGQFDRPMKLFAQAVDLAEMMRAKYSDLWLRSSYLEGESACYYEIIRLCVGIQDHRKAIEYIELLKCRYLIEKIETPKEPIDCTSGEPKSGQGCVETNESRNFLGNVATSDMDSDVLDGRHEKRLSPRTPPNFRVSYQEIETYVGAHQRTLIYLFPMEDRTALFIISPRAAATPVVEYVEGYGTAQISAQVDSLATQSKEDNKDQIKTFLDELLEDLYIKLFVRIEPHLLCNEPITFIPYGGLHLFPLHAMYSHRGSARNYVMDNHPVAYGPSAKVLQHCTHLDRQLSEHIAVVSANPDGNRPLFYSTREADFIARSFGVSPILKASRGDMLGNGKNASILHYTGHADGESLLLHAETDKSLEEQYSVSEIFESLVLPNTYLATLSACETGKVSFGKTDEYIGLPSAFLHAGAATVVCSLWQVSDISTALLMAKMYGFIKQGVGKAEALRKSQRWLRDSEKAEREALISRVVKAGQRISLRKGAFDAARLLPDDLSHPYYWAGFICSGAP